MKTVSLLLAALCLSVFTGCGAAPIVLPHIVPIVDPAASGPMAEAVGIGPNIVEVTARHADGTVFYHQLNHNLKTTDGIDIIAVCLGGNGCPLSLTWLNLSNDSAAPAAGDCVAPGNAASCPFPGLISTNGLAPAQGTFSHSSGTNTYSLSKTWTATGTVSNVQKAAVSGFNLSTCTNYGCYFVFENSFTPVSLNANDQITVQWTVTIT